MNKKKLLALLAKKEARKSASTEDIAELRGMNTEIDSLNSEIAEFTEMIAEIDAEEARSAAALVIDSGIAGMAPVAGTELGSEARGAKPSGQLNPIATYATGGKAPEDQGSEARGMKIKAEAEVRGKTLLEGRSVTIAANVLLAKYTDNTLNKTFNQVSSLIDRVTTKPLIGGESYSKGYVKGYGTGDYTAEGIDYTEAEPIFGYADINKTKITSYAEDTEELLKLSAANYDAEVVKGITIASRKKISREILVGTGATGHMVGIFSALATAIDPLTDLDVTAIDANTLDDIIFSYGGDEDVEAAAVLILNKKDLKAFAVLRDIDSKKIYDIVTNGNTGTINTIPYIINSACKAVSDVAVLAGGYCMAYGPLENYLVTVFSQMDVQRSLDFKFKQGMIANKSSIFVGGNVVSYNGFLRVTKG